MDWAGLSYDRYEAAKSLVKAPRWIGAPCAKNGLREFDKLPAENAVDDQQIAKDAKAPDTVQAPSTGQPTKG